MKKGYKECPYCKNEIKEEAKKCQFCKEFLSQPTDFEETEETSKNTEISIETDNINKSIKWGDITKGFMRGYIIWVAIDFLIVLSDGNISEGAEILINCIFIYGALIAQIGRWYITYKGLQNAKISGLTFPTGWGRLIFGWFCPIACFYVPYQIVRDIVAVYQQKTGKERKVGIVGRRWFFSIIASCINMMVLGGDVEAGVYFASYAFDFIEYIIFIIIIGKVQNMERDYLK